MKTICTILVLCIFSTSLLWAAAYDDMLAKMNKLANTYPNYVQIIDIGQNDQGNTIYGMKVENTQCSTEGTKVPQLLVGCHHGNEKLSADVCPIFVEKTVKKMMDKNSSEYKALSRSVFYVIPVLNIGGYNSNSRTEKNKAGKSFDPNRDYPDPCAQNTHFQLASIKNLAYFVEKFNIVGAVTAHGYIGTFTFPWGMYTSNTKTKDHSQFLSMAQQSVKANGYRIGTHADVIYPASGSFEDWAYHTYGVWCMLLEHKSGANLDKDADCLVAYFCVVPDVKSKDHAHPANNCNRDATEGPGRP